MQRLGADPREPRSASRRGAHAVRAASGSRGRALSHPVPNALSGGTGGAAAARRWGGHRHARTPAPAAGGGAASGSTCAASLTAVRRAAARPSGRRRRRRSREPHLAHRVAEKLGPRDRRRHRDAAEAAAGPSCHPLSIPSSARSVASRRATTPRYRRASRRRPAASRRAPSTRLPRTGRHAPPMSAGSPRAGGDADGICSVRSGSSRQSALQGRLDVARGDCVQVDAVRAHSSRRHRQLGDTPVLAAYTTRESRPGS